MAITVVKKWTPGAEYIGRPSPLGNPFPMQNESQRDEVCDKYKAWFDKQVKDNNPIVMNELRRLYTIAKVGDLKLGCFCAPKRCHGDTIKAFLETYLME